MTERGGVRGGRSSAKVGPAEGRARGVSPDAAGSEVGSGVTAVPTRPAPQGRGVLCLRLLQSACLGPPPSPRPPGVASPRSALVLCDDHFCHGPGSAVKAWLVPSARPRRHSPPGGPVPAPQRPTQYRVHHPVLASSQQLRAPRGPLDADGAPGSPLPPASLPKLPTAPRATSVLQASTLGGSPAWNPPPTLAHPRGSPCWCPKLSVGRAGRPPRPRGASEVAAVGPSLCGITPREETGCGNRVALAHSSNSRMSRAGEGGAGLSGTPLGPHSPEQAWAQPGPSGRRAVTPKSPVSTALEFLATLGHGLT